MTRAEVIATESVPLADIRQDNGETVLRYDPAPEAELAGRLIYIFADGKLVRAKYISSAQHSDLNDFIADFHTVEPLLLEKYGKPAAERAVWDSDEYQLERLPYLDQDRALASNILPSDLNAGLSVSLGNLRLYTERIKTRTKIVHALSGKDSHIVHQIEYRSVELEGLERNFLQRSR